MGSKVNNNRHQRKAMNRIRVLASIVKIPSIQERCESIVVNWGAHVGKLYH